MAPAIQTGGEQNTMTKTTKGNKKNRKGFSLLELIVVVAILGIIATAVMLNAGQFTYPAKVNTWRTSMESLKNALVIHASLHGGSFPGEPGSAEEINTWLADKGGIYLDKRIENPFNVSATVNICGSGGTLKPLDTATSGGCVLQYTATNITDPVTGIKIENGRIFLEYKIGNQTFQLNAP